MTMLRCLSRRAVVAANLTPPHVTCALPMLPGLSIASRRTMSGSSSNSQMAPRSLSGGGSVCAKCWLSYGEFDTPDETVMMEVTSLEGLYKEVGEKCGLSPMDFKGNFHKIEVQHGQRWKEVKSLSDLMQVQGDCGATIRVPTFYSDGQYSGDDLSRILNLSLDDIVSSIWKEMKKKNLKPISKLNVSNNGKTTMFLSRKESPTEIIPTKQFILNLALANDIEDLREILINRIGTLHHLAEAVHYPFAEKLNKSSETP